MLIFAAIVVLACMSITFKSNNTPVAKEDENVKLLEVGHIARQKLDTTIKRIPAIVGIQIVTINFKKNIRVETYINIDVPTVKDLYNKYNANKLFETPLFTADKKNNQRVLHLINGEFMCVPYKDSTAYKYVPQLDQVFITDVCAIGIPPYGGDASGILTFYLKSPQSDDDKKTLFLIARDISTIVADDNK